MGRYFSTLGLGFRALHIKYLQYSKMENHMRKGVDTEKGKIFIQDAHLGKAEIWVRIKGRGLHAASKVCCFISGQGLMLVWGRELPPCLHSLLGRALSPEA